MARFDLLENLEDRSSSLLFDVMWNGRGDVALTWMGEAAHKSTSDLKNCDTPLPRTWLSKGQVSPYLLLLQASLQATESLLVEPLLFKPVVPHACQEAAGGSVWSSCPLLSSANEAPQTGGQQLPFPTQLVLMPTFEWQKLKSLPLGLEGCSWEGHTFFFFFQPHKEYRIILKANIPWISRFKGRKLPQWCL